VKAAVDNYFGLRRELVVYAQAQGIHAASRKFGCARNTVRLWLRRFLAAGNEALMDRSRRPHRQPRKCSQKAEEAVIAARKRAPCFGARRLVEYFELPVGKGAAHRVLRDRGLLRVRQKKHRRKADLRRIKANHPPLRRWQMDTKYLDDIPHYWPQMKAQCLPRFQYTLRDEGTGAVFLAYASELSKTYATLASSRLVEHLRRFGIPLNEVEVRTDLGIEFDGDTRRYRPDGFHGSLINAGVRHRFNPPARPNANADVESFHATVEAEFFDLESFRGEDHFLASIATYQTWFNFGRKNRSRFNQTPDTRQQSSHLGSTRPPPASHHPQPPPTSLPGSGSIWTSRNSGGTAGLLQGPLPLSYRPFVRAKKSGAARLTAPMSPVGNRGPASARFPSAACVSPH
jgi:transposase